MRRQKIGKHTLSLTKWVLFTIGVGALIVTAPVVAPGAGLVFQKIEQERIKQAKKSRVRYTIRRLLTQNLISWHEDNGQVRLTVTEKGKRRILQYEIDNLQLKKTSDWDGFFRIVVFDIPETKRLARGIFRDKLRVCLKSLTQLSRYEIATLVPINI